MNYVICSKIHSIFSTCCSTKSFRVFLRRIRFMQNKRVISCSYSLYKAKEQISKRVFQGNKARKDGLIGITEHPKKYFLNIKNLQNLFNLTKQYNCKKHNQKVYQVEYYVEHLIIFLS